MGLPHFQSFSRKVNEASCRSERQVRGAFDRYGDGCALGNTLLPLVKWE